ncbi:DUF1254 domain-containing protein [Alginatibacterium sediminis]|uniref:DUF1254 domain-containing protein n=1 Tax=Alginatibacterium sediminis TaxID=2164068 RepID=A0A420EN81_9ALTE|nr:DUF1254 domain-containing protein [Alginatibacterium sediminis]RKF22177.1 DUF1254 domain-containing protein [Alginatibacterium sediminis]
MNKLSIFSKSLVAMSIMTITGVNAAPADSLDEFFVPGATIVTAETYPTLETSHQLLKNQDISGVNKFQHKRQLTPTDEQPVVRMNRDTYYSLAVVDVSKGASVTIPQMPEGKYVSVQPVTEDHRIQPMFYGAGTFDLETHIGTHLYLVVRLDSTLSEAEAAEIQNQMTINANSSQLFSAQPVDEQSFRAVEDELKAKMLEITERDGAQALTGMFTAPNDDSNKLFTQEKYEVGAAVGWGGAQEIDNIYELSGEFPADTCYQANFDDPNNQAFWSITVYDKAGFMFNDLANLSSNKIDPNADGTYTVSFGCGDDALNNIETQNDTGVFTLGIRHYQPSDKVRLESYRVLPSVVQVK